MRIVKAIAVRQTNEETGEVNLTLTTDPLTPLDDFGVTAGNWKDAKIQRGEVVLVGDEDVLRSIMEKEFRSVAE